MSQVRIGVIGVGKMGGYHLSKFLAEPMASVVGVFDSDMERAKSVAQAKGVSAFKNLSELLFECDGAVIATPTEQHATIAKQALQAGVHVLVEKPMASTVDEARELVLLAEKNNLTLAVGHLERYRVRHYLNEMGISGAWRPVYMEAQRYHTDLGREPRSIDVISDLMLHDLDYILALSPTPPATFSVSAVSVVSGLPDFARVWMEFEEGATATIAASRVSAEVRRQFWAHGAEGTVFLDLLNQTGARSHANRSGGVGQQTQQFAVDCLQMQARQFLSCLAGRNARPWVTGRDALTTLEWVSRIREQWKTSLLMSGSEPDKTLPDFGPKQGMA